MEHTENNQNLSRKERRALKQQEKQARRDQEQQKEQQTSFTQNILTWGLVSLLGIGLILFVVGLLGNEGGLTQSDEVDIELAEDEWITGNPEADVTLVEYGDLQCPACRQAHISLLRPLLNQYGDSIRVAYRHFPLPNHTNAFDAALAAEAAGRQDAFFDMVDVLYENQSKWESERNPYPTFEEYATELGLDATQFEEDFNSDDVRSAVEEDRSSGNSYAVSATPTFFLNGKRLSNMSFADMQAEIMDAIEASQTEQTEEPESSAPESNETEDQQSTQ